MVKDCPFVFLVVLLGLTLTGCETDKPPAAGDTLPSNPTRPVITVADGDRRPGAMDRESASNRDDAGTISPMDVEVPAFQGRNPADTAAILEPGGQEIAQSIFFGFDEFNIRASERDKLAEVANLLEIEPGLRIIAEGHTSWHGTEQYNLGLGDRRAQAVKNFLVNLGVDGSRVSASSMGELEANQDADRNDAAAVQDRRVDLILVRQDG